MRKRTFYAIHVITILLVISLRALGQDGFPQVKIIHYGIGHGDCTLIIVRERDPVDTNTIITVSVLIDVGGRGNQAVRHWNEIWRRIQAEGGERLDYFVVSHFHKDHMGAAARILERIRRLDRTGAEVHRWRKDMIIIDRSMFPIGPSTNIYSRWALPPNLPPPPPPQRIGTYARYRQEIDQHWNTNPMYQLHTGDDLFQGYNLTYSQMICVVSNGAVGTTRIAQPAVPNVIPPRALSENDLSFGFILSVGSFRYYTGGDLSGEARAYAPGQPAIPEQPALGIPGRPARSARGGQSAMEGPLVNYLGGRVGANFHTCAFKFNHHGSNHSTTNEFLRFLNPRIGVFTANHRRFGSTVRLPSYELIERINVVFPRGRPPGSQRPVLLYTFRFAAQVDATRQVLRTSEARVLAYQDIILSVREELGFSLRVGQAPRIQLFRQEREVDRFVPIGNERYHNVINQGGTSPPRYNVIDCDRASHTNLPLEYFPPPPGPQPPE